MTNLVLTIVDVLEKTFNTLDRAYSENDESAKKANFQNAKTHLIFPQYSTKYRKGEKRVSEQELRFCFIESFSCATKNLEYYFSIETPTEEKYRFSDNPSDYKGPEPPRVQCDKDEEYDKSKKEKCARERKKFRSICESAQFDTVIYDSNCQRIALIEFKGNSSEPKDYTKDFLKLNTEGIKKGLPCFFIQVLEDEKDNKWFAEKLFNTCNPDLQINDIIYICHYLPKQNNKSKTIFYWKNYKDIMGHLQCSVLDSWEELNFWKPYTKLSENIKPFNKKS